MLWKPQRPSWRSRARGRLADYPITVIPLILPYGTAIMAVMAIAFGILMLSSARFREIGWPFAIGLVIAAFFGLRKLRRWFNRPQRGDTITDTLHKEIEEKKTAGSGD